MTSPLIMHIINVCFVFFDITEMFSSKNSIGTFRQLNWGALTLASTMDMNWKALKAVVTNNHKQWNKPADQKTKKTKTNPTEELNVFGIHLSGILAVQNLPSHLLKKPHCFAKLAHYKYDSYWLSVAMKIKRMNQIWWWTRLKKKTFLILNLESKT